VAGDVTACRGEARIDRRRGATARAARSGSDAAGALAERRRCALLDRLHRGERPLALGSVQRIAARGRGERALDRHEAEDENETAQATVHVDPGARQSASSRAAAFASALPASNSARRRAISSAERRSTLQ